MNQRSNCKHSLDHSKSKRIPEKNSISASLTMLECLIEWTTTNCSVQCSCSVVSDPFHTRTPWQHQLPELSTELVIPSNHLILCHPLFLPPSNFFSIRVFSNESVLHIRWPNYWRFSFNIRPSKEYSTLISFRMDWLNLLAVQGTLKRLLKHQTSRGSIFSAQLSLYSNSNIHTWLLVKT